MGDRSQEEQALMKIQHEWAEARVKGDSSYTRRLEAEDCTIVWPDGRIVNKRGDLESMTGDIVFSEFKIHNLQVRLYGDTGIVVGEGIIKAHRESKISSTENSSGPTHLRNRAVNGRWSLRKSLRSWKNDHSQLSVIVMNKFALGCGVLIAILLFVVVVAAIAIGGSYNRLVRLQQAVDQSWAQVQNVYQRRADLIPNLVNTVSGAANFEKSTLVEVTNARASVGRVQMQLDPNKAPADAAQLAQFQAAQGQLSNALSRLLLVSERYPELKANQNFLSLQAQLEGTENRISVERGNFNKTVQDYNVAVRSFPTNLIAGMLGFPPKPFFTAQPGAEKPPPVQFNFSSPAPAPAATAAP
jgi:LemA protein